MTLLCAITRLFAIPASPWEWDDILFARALHRFDVSAHSPHPPGFPIFVMLGRLGYAVLGDEHRAYAAVSLVFGSLLGASLFYFYREVFHDSTVALAGALIGSFAPNVWVHGSALRSDGPALTLGIIGLTLAIRGLRSRGSLLMAGALFGLSMGVRITLLPVMGPALTFVLLDRLRARRWQIVSATLAVAAGTVLSWCVPLVLHTGWRAYRAAVAQHAQYTFSTDAFLATAASAMPRFRLQRFFVDIWGAWWLMGIVYTCAGGGVALLLRRRQWRAIGWLAVSFLPIMAFTLAINTPLAAPLYSLPYVPLFAGLAGFAIVTGARLIAHRMRRPGLAHIGPMLAGGLTIGLIVWTYPVIAMLRSEESPPVRAAEYLRRTLDPDRDFLYYDGLFQPHVIFYLPQLKMSHQGIEPDLNLIDPLPDRRYAYSLTAEPLLGVGGQAFHWASRLGSRRLFALSIGRYFDAYVSGPLAMFPVRFLSGWFPQEHRGKTTWRWMGGRSRTAMYVGADRMTLHLRAVLPPSVPQLTVVLRLDGAEVDRLRPMGDTIDRTLTVRPGGGRLWSILALQTDQVTTSSLAGPSTNGRELGLQCYELTWSAADNSRPTITSQDQFLGSGWYPLETNGRASWRWTKDQAVAYLPPIEGDGRLEVTMRVPEGSDGTRSTVTVEVAGQVLDRFQPLAGLFTNSYRVPGSPQQGALTELRLSAEPVKVASDPRRLSILVTHVGWTPAGEQ